jgi:hypothetical protein
MFSFLKTNTKQETSVETKDENLAFDFLQKAKTTQDRISRDEFISESLNVF